MTKRKSPTPENRRGTGVKTLKGGLDPTIGKKTQSQPGKTGNAGGRPRKLPLTEAYEKILYRQFPGDPNKRTFAELIAEGQAKAAIKGKTEATREMCDRVEGKVTLAISGPQGAPIPMVLDLGVSPGRDIRI
jgi:Family of unknown function (DUF5681)